jgi:hypothetical protein
LYKYNQAIVDYSRQIKEFEDKELSLDDLDSDRSAYIIESKLKKRFVNIKEKYYELAKKYPHLIQDDVDVETGLSENISNLKQHKRLKRGYHELEKYSYTRFPDLNEKIVAFFRKNKEFPDFADIESLIVKYNSELGLGLRSEACGKMAIEVFKLVGKNFKKKREDYDRGCLLSHFESTSDVLGEDPARNDENLKAIFIKNRQNADEKIDKILSDFVYKQENGQDYEDDDEDDEEEESIESIESEVAFEIETETDGEVLPVLEENNNDISSTTTKTSDDFSFKTVCRSFEAAISSEDCFAAPDTTTVSAQDEQSPSIFQLNDDIKQNLSNRNFQLKRFSRYSRSSTSSAGSLSKSNLPKIVAATSSPPPPPPPVSRNLRSSKTLNAQKLFSLLDKTVNDEADTSVIVID